MDLQSAKNLSRFLHVGTRTDPGFNASTMHQQNPNYRTNKTLTLSATPAKQDEVSPEVEAGGVAGLRCLQPSWDIDL
jgi:hypothetical protein